MAVDSKSFFDFAKSITATSEINNRSSASRAYYACYHKCLENYDVTGYVGIKGGIHEQMIRILKASSDKKEKEVAYYLAQARSLRVVADYKLEESFRKNDQETAILYAETIFEQLNK